MLPTLCLMYLSAAVLENQVALSAQVKLLALNRHKCISNDVCWDLHLTLHHVINHGTVLPTWQACGFQPQNIYDARDWHMVLTTPSARSLKYTPQPVLANTVQPNICINFCIDCSWRFPSNQIGAIITKN